mmetsp:Transcript_49124/g.127461  ORF Transcript_49124/g.127461 Transcript_49124/m.127461 type:complete len:221 (+) Transcript_49124:424-1086(+)
MDIPVRVLAGLVGRDPRRDLASQRDRHGIHDPRRGHVHTRRGVLDGRCQERAWRHGRVVLHWLQHFRYPCWAPNPLDYQDRIHRGHELRAAVSVAVPGVLRGPAARHGPVHRSLHPPHGLEAQQAAGAGHGSSLRDLPHDRYGRGSRGTRRPDGKALTLRQGEQLIGFACGLQRALALRTTAGIPSSSWCRCAAATSLRRATTSRTRWHLQAGGPGEDDK